jgi:outer membrane biosynthesis protein TonB
MSPSEKKPVSTRLATAVPGAFGAALLIGAVAFGANSLRSAATELEASRAAAAASAEEVQPVFGATVAVERRDAFAHDPKPHPVMTDAPKPQPAPTEEAKPSAEEAAKEPAPAEQPKTQPTEKPKPAPVETKKPAPTEKPAPAPNPTGQVALSLQGWAQETKAKLAWTVFNGDGFAYYKVVRSADTQITFPTTGDDQLIGAIGDRNAPWAADKPPCGTPWNYAVFAVAKSNGTYVVLGYSNVVTVATTCAPPPPPIVVKPLAFQLFVNPGAGITLSWEGCWSDGFQAYKVVRSKVHADPRFPLNDGSELIGVIGDPNQTVFTDTAVAAGETWTYRVVAVTKHDGQYLPLCETAAMAATAQ